jgi:hypothetical protein
LKRFLVVVLLLGVSLAMGVAVLRAELPGPDDRQDKASPSATAADVPVPAHFRQNQPRHWRYMMLSQSK